MTQVLALALGTAAANVAMSRWLQGLGGRYWWTQGLGFALRLTTIFGGAHTVWSFRRQAGEVVVFIMTAAVAQLVGQIYFLVRKQRIR